MRLSVPTHVPDNTVREFLRSKLSWIKKQQAKIRSRPKPQQRSILSGESVYLWGKRHRLEVIEHGGRYAVQITGNGQLRMYVRRDTTRENREVVLTEFYRAEMKKRVPDLIPKWEALIGKQVAEWCVKKMKTRWGSCNVSARRIWVNLELAKRPVECLEYILVHEMVHLLERGHNKKFYSYLDQFMPGWRAQREELKGAPGVDGDWEY